MFQLIMAVMTIALMALIVTGGYNYFNEGIGFRTEFDQALRSQHNTIMSAVSSYRVANSGYVPQTMSQLDGFLPASGLPALPRGLQPFDWVFLDLGSGNVRLCLTRTTEGMVYHVAEATLSFTEYMADRGNVSFAVGTCAQANASSLPISDLTMETFTENSEVSIVFEEL